MKEAVDHPSHYNSGTIEVIEVIRDQGWHADFCLGNALKYIMRAKHKNNFLEDLRKAIWYLQYLVDHVGDEKKDTEPPKGTRRP